MLAQYPTPCTVHSYHSHSMSILVKCMLFHNDIEKIHRKRYNYYSYMHLRHVPSITHGYSKVEWVGLQKPHTLYTALPLTHTLKPDLQWDGTYTEYCPPKHVCMPYSTFLVYVYDYEGGVLAAETCVISRRGSLSCHCALLLTCSVSNVQLSHILIIVYTHKREIHII